MNKKNWIILLGFLGLMLLLSNCKHERVFPSTATLSDTCSPDTVYFKNVILPLIQSNCAQSGCHDDITRAEDVILDTYDNIINTGGIDRGNANNSIFYTVMITPDLGQLMPPPPNQPMTAEQISQVATWINQGALNNACAETCDTTNVTFSGSVWPLIQRKCTGCHSGTPPQGGIPLTNHAQVSAFALSGLLLSTMRGEPGFSLMPPGNAVPACEIDLIQLWIDDGAPNN